MDNKPDIELNKGQRPLNDYDDECLFDGSLLFDQVSFAYPTRTETQVLKDVTLHVERGKTLALVGPSGGGKSTLFALIERFYDPDSGDIRLGPSNTSLKSVSTGWLHSRIGLVSQEPVLFGGTIRDNIAFGIDTNELIDDERIVEAARLANAHDFIITFENGYETLVGERGIRLSGGQKQSL
jgi:ATP-binding cassette subfamily B (MDR/TAP) protein 1